MTSASNKILQMFRIKFATKGVFRIFLF